MCQTCQLTLRDHAIAVHSLQQPVTGRASLHEGLPVRLRAPLRPFLRASLQCLRQSAAVCSL